MEGYVVARYCRHDLMPAAERYPVGGISLSLHSFQPFAKLDHFGLRATALLIVLLDQHLIANINEPANLIETEQPVNDKITRFADLIGLLVGIQLRGRARGS